MGAGSWGGCPRFPAVFKATRMEDPAMRPLRTQQLFTDESPPHMFLATLRRAHSGTARSQGVPTLCL